MDNLLHAADWSLIQSFLAVAETGSLSSAATALGHSQPTLGRHIKTLEATLGTELFHRHARGLVLTDVGTQVLPAARAMRAAMAQIALAAEAHSDSHSGTVRIACSVFAAHHILPPLIDHARQCEPDISIVVHASDDSDNLLFREADIALRMYRPKQLELVALHIGDIRMGVFAAHSYLQRRGVPQSPDDLRHHDLVGFDQSTLILDAMAALGLEATAEDFPVRCDNQTAYWQLVCAGCGIGFTQMRTGRDDPRVQELPLDLPLPSLPLWLTAHEVVRRTPRVDRIWGVLAQGLTAMLADIDPCPDTG